MQPSLTPLTREIVVNSKANEVCYAEIRKYRSERGLVESAGSYFCAVTGGVEMVRLFAKEDGARNEYAAGNHVLFEDGDAMEMKIALPREMAIREKFAKNFEKNGGTQEEIVRVFISTKLNSLETLEGDGWVNKEWGLGTVCKIDTTNTLPTWFQVKRDVFMIEEILANRGTGNNAEYLIRWKGYNKEWDTWEPQINILGNDAIDQYIKKCDEAVEISEDEEDYASQDEDYDYDESSIGHGNDSVSFVTCTAHTQSTDCDSTVRDLRLQIARTKKAYYQARKCMQRSLQNATDELKAASRVFAQLTVESNDASGQQSRKRLRCDVGVFVDNLRTVLDEEFINLNE